ncbi:ABC transporter permease [Alphaproteobacteria bacterium LSUCC0684]
MLAYLVRKAVLLAASLLMASLLVFALIEVIPGDPAAYMLGINARADTLLALRAELGLDAAAPLRYWQWISGMMTGDFGISYTYRVPVLDIVLERLAVSVPLALYALVLAVAMAFPAAIMAAHRKGSRGDRALLVMTQIGIAVPNFWLAILLVYVFSLMLGWFSAGGFDGWSEGVAQGMKALTLPAIALALPQAAILARVMRESLIETLREDYIRTARAKGLTRFQALFRHGLRNALIPVLTILGMQFSFLLAGAIIIENVFFLPGLGRLVFQAIAQRDLILVESVVFLLMVAVMTVTFLVDVAYALVDPRIRGGRP